MRPKPPRSMTARRYPHEWYIFLLMVALAAVWEAGWLVLSLAGAEPRGQLPQAFVRVTAAVHLALANHPVPRGLPHMLWAARPVSPTAVVLVVVGLLVAITVVVRLVLRVLEFGSMGGGRRGGGGRGGPSGGQPAPTATVDKSLDEWLAGVAAGENDQ